MFKFKFLSIIAFPWVYLFNDTGSKDPVGDLASAITKKNSPSTYFASDTALLQAGQLIFENHINDLEDLLKNNPDLSLKTNSDGYSLLYYTVMRKNIAAIKLLIQYKSDTNQVFTSNKTTYSVITYFLDNNTHNNISKEDLLILELLIKGGSLLNYPYKSGEIVSPIFYISLKSQKPFLQKLVENGADINLPGFGGETILYRELYGIPDPDWIRFLLDLGADPNVKSNAGTNSLELFCKYSKSSSKENKKKIYNIFIEKGFNPPCNI